MKTVVIIFIFLMPSFLWASVLSETIGRVGENVYTSRQAQVAGLMERILSNSKDLNPSVVAPPSELFKKERAAFLLEVAVAKESEAFGLMNSESEEVSDLFGKTQKVVQSKSDWKKFQFQESELKQIAQIKIASKALVKLKSESMKSPVSDVEAQKYFEENRKKFGNVSIESFRTQIKNVLEREQLDERLRSWFEIIRRKYQVRESQSGSAATGN